MKKLYTTILFVFAFFALASAQTEIYNSGFTEASYDAIDGTDLNAHADWKAGHFGNTNTWISDGTNNQLYTGSNFAYSVLATPITAASGDVVTITTVIMLGYDNQVFSTTSDKSMIIAGLTASATPTNVQLGQEREGVNISALIAGSGTVEMGNAGGTGNFAPSNPSLSQAAKAAYEVIMEYNIGADAGSSNKEVRIRNIGSNETSIIGTVNGLRAQVYTAITGAGAFYFNWGISFFEAGAGNINRVLNNSILITKNSPLLSTKERNAFEFSMYPNPVKSTLNINTREPLQKVEVYDLLGKSVLSVKNVSESIDVSSLSKSIYIVKLTSEHGVSTKKFIKD